MAAVLDFKDVGLIVHGGLEQVKLKLVPDCIAYKARSGEVTQFPVDEIKSLAWMRASKGFELKIIRQNGNIIKFHGFKEQDHHSLIEFSKKHYGKEIPETEVSLKGCNWGDLKFDDSLMSFKVDSRTAFEVPLQEVSQVLTAKNEVTLEFHQEESTAVSILELRLYVPNSTEEEDPVKAVYDDVRRRAKIMEVTGDAVAVFEELHVLTPRGRYDFTAYPTFIQFHGKTFDYKIPYNSISRQFLLPMLDSRQMLFAFQLNPPLRQGQTRYPFVIMQFMTEEECSMTLPISEEECSKYGGHMRKEMSGPVHEVFSKVVRAMVGKKIIVPSSFKGNSGTSFVSCSHKATSGQLYPLDKSFIFVHKPAVFIRYEDIGLVNFARLTAGSGASRSFDLEVELKSGTSHVFSSMMKDDYGPLYDFVTKKGIRMKNKGKEKSLGGSSKDQEMDPYLERMKAEGEVHDSEDEDSDFVANESSEEDLEFDSEAELDSSSGGEVVEEKIERKRKASKSEQPAKRRKGTTRAKKDPLAPKKPLSAYMLWLQDIRPEIKADNPSAGIIDISKIAGEKWKLISSEDKAKYEGKAAERKQQYQSDMADYRASGGGGSGGGPSKSRTPTKSTSSKASPKKTGGDSSKFTSAEYIEDSDEELASSPVQLASSTGEDSDSSDDHEE